MEMMEARRNGVLVIALQRASGRGVGVIRSEAYGKALRADCAYALQEPFRRVFELASFESLFRIYNSSEEASKSCQEDY
jgi:hypothetical protein